jgi:hypothetical protein
VKTETQEPGTFTPGWYVVKGVSHHFRGGKASLCGGVYWSPRCERRRWDGTVGGTRGQLVPRAETCGACKEYHAQMWGRL